MNMDIALEGIVLPGFLFVLDSVLLTNIAQLLRKLLYR